MSEESNKPIISKHPIRPSDTGEDRLKLSNPRKKTNKKVVYLELDEEITSVYDRLKHIKVKNIYLVVPRRAILFQSFINLKILKQTAENLKKNIYIITNDPNGLHLASRIGLPVYDKLESQDHPSLVSALSEDQIIPLKASINTLNDDTPVIRKEKKLSISELLRRQQQGILWWILRQFGKVNLMSKNPPQPKAKKEKGKFVLLAPNRHALLALIVISIFVLITITYIALPGATITLTPKTTILSHNVNVVLADVEKNQAELDLHPLNMIASYTVSTKVPKILKYETSGKEFKGENAKGQLTVFNENTTEQPLRAGTRFQTPDGLIFKSPNAIKVPPARNGEPGKLIITVEAAEMDENKVFIGERGNIQPTRFFLPGLTSEENRKKVYAISTEPFSGGKTAVRKFVTEEDLRKAHEKMLDELKASAQAELEAYIKSKNENQKTNLALLQCKTSMAIPCNDIIKLDDVTITLPTDLEGQEIESFEVQGEAIATGIAYNRDELKGLLTTELKKYTSPQKRFDHVVEESLGYDIIEVNQSNRKITITASLKGIEEYEIRPTEENGKRFLNTIKDHVAGKDLKEAELFIQNLPEVEKVEIENWPGWSPSLPTVAGNIKIEIKR